jgi:hypothetical protein
MRPSNRGLGAFAAALAAAPAIASVLTFNIDGLGNHGTMPQDYGDRIESADQGIYHYGLDGGTTPNITVSYTKAPAVPAFWSTGYGDLTNILFDDADNVGQIEIVLTADLGYTVSLTSFDLGAYDGVFNQDPVIDAVSVAHGCGADLFRQDDVAISEKARTTFDFSAEPLTGRVIVILVECGNLGGLSDDIGIDNVQFSQAADEACYGDYNADDALDLFDFLEFVNSFNDGDSRADCDASCGYDLFDFLCFTNAFNAGC